MTDPVTLAAGEIDQIDYDEKGRITVLHVRDPLGASHEIRVTYPQQPMPDLMPGQRQYAILSPSRRPEVSVVRLA